MKCLVKTTIKATLGGVSEYHVFLIAQQLTLECLLGSDLLSQYGCVVDLRQHVIIAGGKKVPLVDRKKKSHALVCFVSTSESVKVPASCQIHFLESHGLFLRMFIVEPLAKFINDY